MTLMHQRVEKRADGRRVTGVILDHEPDKFGLVNVHWGVADGKAYRSVEPLADFNQIASPPLPLEGTVGWAS